MAGKFDSAPQKITPLDAQKGGQGAISKEHPELALNQDAPRAADPSLPDKQAPDGLTARQIDLLCEIEERDAPKLTHDNRHDIEQLLSQGYVESVGPRFRLTAKGADFVGKRGLGLNEA